MIKCARCQKEITRPNPKYCYRCGYFLYEAIISNVPGRLTPSAELAPRVLQVQPVAPTATSEESETDESLALGTVDEPTEVEITADGARMVERSVRRKMERRSGRRGFVAGIVIVVVILGLLHMAGIRIRLIPFAQVGGRHLIALSTPATALGYIWEIIGTLLMLSSLAVPRLRIHDFIRGVCMPRIQDQLRRTCATQFRFFCVMTILTLSPYLIGAVCLAIGR